MCSSDLDLVAGRYQLPWEDQVVHVDGRACGFPVPERNYAPVRAVPPAPPAGPRPEERVEAR